MTESESPPVYASIGSLIRPVEDAETTDVTLPSGGVVQVRGLTRRELHSAGQGTEDVATMEARNLAACVVTPKLTLAQAMQWQQSPGSVLDIARVTEAIRDLSGLGEGADKSDVDEAGD